MRPNPLIAIRADIYLTSPPWRTERIVKRTLEQPFSSARGALRGLQHSTMHADVRAERGGAEADRSRGCLERAFPDRAPHRIDDVLRSMLRDRAADHDDGWIQAIHDADREVRECTFRADDERLRASVTRVGRREHISSPAAAELLREVGARGERLDATERSALAARHTVAGVARRVELESDGPVAKLASGVRDATHHAATRDDRATYPGRHGHVHEVFRAAGRTDE